MKKIIISQRLVYHQDQRGEVLDGLDRRFADYIIGDLGNLLYPVPNFNLDRRLLDAWIANINPDLIILSGGGDVGEDLIRDNIESRLIDVSEQLDIPLLGICRGMQQIAMRQGVHLQRVSDHVGNTHEVSGDYNMRVNSWHNYSIKSCPPHFEVTSRSEDFEIESIRHESLKIEGWMWHPEREDGCDGPMKNAFRHFLNTIG